MWTNRQSQDKNWMSAQTFHRGLSSLVERSNGAKPLENCLLTSCFPRLHLCQPWLCVIISRVLIWQELVSTEQIHHVLCPPLISNLSSLMCSDKVRFFISHLFFIIYLFLFIFYFLDVATTSFVSKKQFEAIWEWFDFMIIMIIFMLLF